MAPEQQELIVENDICGPLLVPLHVGHKLATPNNHCII
jgi:hypothetical protein